ncbi:MAG: CIA30 family protein [Planctomycetota bacterium]
MPHRLPLVMVAFAFGSGASALNLTDLDPEPAGSPPSLTLADFDGDSPRVDGHSGAWRVVNDGVMGGLSIGDGRIEGGAMVFAGSINTNGGGFSSLRARDASFDLSDFDGVSVRVRGDGRTYVVQLYTGLWYRFGDVSYRGTVRTESLVNADGQEIGEDGRWQEVFIPFDDFVPMVRGMDVTGRVETLDRARIKGLGLMLSDGIDGPFRLEVDWLMATRDGSSD